MEIFKDTKVDGYEVSNTGKVFTKERWIKANDLGTLRLIKRREKVLTANDSGYLFLQLYYDNVSTRAYIHRLVAQAFIPNPENKPTVNHKDGNKGNNHVDNLEWSTYKENNAHAIATGLTNHKHLMKQVRQLDLQDGKWVNIAEFESASDASRKTGVNRVSIASCVVGLARSAGGYRWEFTDNLNE